MYFAWLVEHLAQIEMLGDFNDMVSHSMVNQVWADKVECALDFRIVSEKVPVLNKMLTAFLPQGVTPVLILVAISYIMRTFRPGETRGNPRKQKRAMPPSPEMVCFNCFFSGQSQAPKSGRPLWTSLQLMLRTRGNQDRLPIKLAHRSFHQTTTVDVKTQY
jgi:hypothetical protein